MVTGAELAFVIIKGSMKDAVVAANLHGLKLCEPRSVGGGIQVAGVVERSVNVAVEELASVLNGWMIELPLVPPYKAGALLWWRPEPREEAPC